MRVLIASCLVLSGLLLGYGLAEQDRVSTLTPEQERAAQVVPEIPEEAKRVKNPREPNRESLSYGKLLFSSQCTMCHGHDGAGSGDLVLRLDLPIPDFTDSAEQKRWTDGELFYIITEGHGRMPKQKDRFDDNTKWDMINYIRSFESK